MTPLCWEDWIKRYEARGYQVIAPGWPGVDDRTPEEIRKDPKPLEGLEIHTIVDHYSKIIDALPTKPIIMGHSFGGLFTQMLMCRLVMFQSYKFPVRDSCCGVGLVERAF